MANRPCSCIRDAFSLHVTSPAKNVVLIHDFSDWVIDEGFVYPDFYVLGVKYPNGKVENVSVSPKYGFTISRDRLPDGIYEFTLDNCGVVYTQKELITSNVECSIDNAIVKSDGDVDFDKVRDIQNDMLVAKSAATFGNYETADKLLKIANRKLALHFCGCECS